jgi:aminopeptidase N
VGSRNTIDLAVEANRRQMERGRDILGTAAEILRLYAGLVGDAPYEALTIAMVEDDRPGGHAPGYFAVLNNPLPVTPFAFRNDPAMFSNFPEFYVAHELAHQWWGQAVGWKNYHEQWLSEGFAQYFAALYAKERRGENTFRDVLRQFRRWAMDQSDQGAVYLGYRLGHIRGDSRVFRALVYNKGALVLHMLRRWLGDEKFFAGIRRYYAENRYSKAGTADLQRAFEATAGHSLERFFQRWIYESGLPRVRWSSSQEGSEVVIRFEQLGDVYDIPVTVSLVSADGITETAVTLTEAVVEQRISVNGTARSVDVNADHGALGTFERR